MRVAALSAAVFSTVAVSSAINARQIDVVQGVLDDVSSKLTALDSSITSFTGTDSAPVVSAGEDVVSTIDGGISTVEGSEDLDLAGALGLQGPVGDLTTLSEGLVENLTGKRDQVASLGECKTTRDLIAKINTSSNNLIDAVIAKVPTDAQSIAEGLAADLRKVLETAGTNFNEANCVDSGNGGGDSSATASASASASATASATESGEAPKPTKSSTPAPPAGNGTAPEPPTGAAGALFPAGLLAAGIAAALL